MPPCLLPRHFACHFISWFHPRLNQTSVLRYAAGYYRVPAARWRARGRCLPAHNCDQCLGQGRKEEEEDGRRRGRADAGWQIRFGLCVARSSRHALRALPHVAHAPGARHDSIAPRTLRILFGLLAGVTHRNLPTLPLPCPCRLPAIASHYPKRLLCITTLSVPLRRAEGRMNNAPLSPPYLPCLRAAAP